MVSEEKMFKECGRRWRRMTEANLSYKLTKWAFGSGELKIEEIMTIGRWRAPLYSKQAAKLVQKSHCIVHSRTMVVLFRTNSVLMS